MYSVFWGYTERRREEDRQGPHREEVMGFQRLSSVTYVTVYVCSSTLHNINDYIFVVCAVNMNGSASVSSRNNIVIVFSGKCHTAASLVRD